MCFSVFFRKFVSFSVRNFQNDWKSLETYFHFLLYLYIQFNIFKIGKNFIVSFSLSQLHFHDKSILQYSLL